MKHYLFILLIITVFSCEKPSKLEQKLSCSSSKLENFQTLKDFNKNFIIDIPKTWKTNYYYDNITSEIYAADTILELTKSFIIGVSFQRGSLNLNKEYSKKVDSILIQNKLHKIDSESEIFANKPSYWYLVEGTKNGFNYHQLNIMIKNSDKSYINATAEIYGDSLIDDRICSSISILKTIQFLE